MRHREVKQEISDTFKESGLIKVRHDLIITDDDGFELENAELQIQEGSETISFDASGEKKGITSKFGEVSFQVIYNLSKKVFIKRVGLAINNDTNLYRIDLEIDKRRKAIEEVMEFLLREELEAKRRKEVEEAARRLREEEEKRAKRHRDEKEKEAQARKERLAEPSPETWYERNHGDKVGRAEAEKVFQRLGTTPEKVFTEAVVAHSEFYMRELLEEASEGAKSAEDYWANFNLPLSHDELKKLEAEYKRVFELTGAPPSLELQDQRILNYGGVETLYRKLIAPLGIVDIDHKLVEELNKFGPAEIRKSCLENSLKFKRKKDREGILKSAATKKETRAKLDINIIPKHIKAIYRLRENELIEDLDKRTSVAADNFMSSISIDLATYLLHLAYCKVQLDLGRKISSELIKAARVRLNCFDSEGNMIIATSKCTDDKVDVKLEKVSLAAEIDDLNYESPEAAWKRAEKEADERIKRERENAKERSKREADEKIKKKQEEARKKTEEEERARQRERDETKMAVILGFSIPIITAAAIITIVVNTFEVSRSWLINTFGQQKKR